MGLVIRKARNSDVKKLLEIQKEAFKVQAEKYNAYDIPPMVEEECDVLINSEDVIVLVAEEDGVLAGSIRVAFGSDDAEIKRLSVDGEFQNQGIGRKLIYEAEQYCTHLKRVWLFTGGQSIKNIELYKKLGYAPYKEEPFKDEFTLIYMQKLI